MGGSNGKSDTTNLENNLSHSEAVDKIRYSRLTKQEPSSSGKDYIHGRGETANWGNNKHDLESKRESAKALISDDPQLYTAGIRDPFSSFSFNQGIQWESYYYDDGSIYEGTMTENFPHGKGVLSVGHIGGGGLLTNAFSKEVVFGDVYEGEFNMGFAHGLGRYISRDGYIYTGEFMAGMKHGCGELKDISHYIKRVQAGIDPRKAWQQSVKDIERTKEMGYWSKDYKLQKPDTEFIGNQCPITMVLGYLEEAEQVSTKARLFRYKPDGMAQIFYQEARGIPVKTLQDPLHYPYNTTFLAPGPLAQLHPIPNDISVRNEVTRAQNLWRSIYDSYNFDPLPDMDSTFAYALNMWSESKLSS
jgi:hypothetical protein